MRIQLKDQITINAPANKVWGVLAHDFDKIGQWASAIPESKAVANSPTPEGAPVCGRVCSTAVQGFSHVQEKFTYYDETSMRYGYKAVEGRPSFIKDAVNNWSVREQGPNQSVVESRAELELSFFPGVFMIPLLKLQMRITAARLFEELKYFVERGQPHPRKLKAQQKQLRRASAHS